MKRTAIPPLIAGTLMGLLSTRAAGQDIAPDAAVVDSARLTQMAVQAELSREVGALSRSNLGSGRFTWTHAGQFILERAGRQQKQVFWNNPKASATPHLWQVVNGPSDAVFYLDPEQGRAATIDLETLQGNFIPANIAAKAGFTGNQTQFLSKKSGVWTLSETTDSTTVYKATIDSGSMRLTLHSEKDADQAKAVYEWMRLQPLESIDLPHAARKFPIQSLERTDDKGTAFTFTVTNWTALEEPLEVDANELSIKDIERDLRTIAKEWAAEKNANSDKE